MVFIKNRLPTFLWPVWVAALPWNTTAQRTPDSKRKINQGTETHMQKQDGMFLHRESPEREPRMLNNE
jgi:hypothetical protein